MIASGLWGVKADKSLELNWFRLLYKLPTGDGGMEIHTMYGRKLYAVRVMC